MVCYVIFSYIILLITGLLMFMLHLAGARQYTLDTGWMVIWTVDTETWMVIDTTQNSYGTDVRNF